MKINDFVLFLTSQQHATKSPQVAAKMVPITANLESRWPQDPLNLEPRWSQDPSTWSQDGPKTLNLEPRWSQDPPTWTQNRVKTSQLEAKMAPRSPNTASRLHFWRQHPGHQPPITNHQSPIPNHQSLMTNPQSSTFNLPQGGAGGRGEAH